MRWLSVGKIVACGLFPLILGLSACRNDKLPAGGGRKEAAPILRADGELASLSGLYESGPARARSQLCMIERKGKPTRFATVFRGAGGKVCSGGGTLRREDHKLHLTMAGESACTFEAALHGRKIAFSSAIPSGCAYYCEAGGSFAGAKFTLTGASLKDAARARDLVGEPLCGTS